MTNTKPTFSTPEQEIEEGFNEIASAYGQAVLTFLKKWSTKTVKKYDTYHITINGITKVVELHSDNTGEWTRDDVLVDGEVVLSLECNAISSGLEEKSWCEDEEE